MPPKPHGRSGSRPLGGGSAARASPRSAQVDGAFIPPVILSTALTAKQLGAADLMPTARWATARAAATGMHEAAAGPARRDQPQPARLGTGSASRCREVFSAAVLCQAQSCCDAVDGAFGGVESPGDQFRRDAAVHAADRLAPLSPAQSQPQPVAGNLHNREFVDVTVEFSGIGVGPVEVG
ncbi:MAG: hypothetical protein CK429_05415 [Mycobacterium sp.]|nr:MAG: hypothetical protein CK429_05415 [Mycobacterium sp.]